MTILTKKLLYIINFLKFVKKHECFKKLKYSLPRFFFETKKLNTINKNVNLFNKLNRALIFFIFALFFSGVSPSWAMKEEDESNKNVLVAKNHNASKKNILDTLPKVLIKEISTYLDPVSIIKLSHVSKLFRKCFNEEFFINYNNIHNYEVFNEATSGCLMSIFTKKVPPVKVTIANYYYEIGVKTEKQILIEKASLLGLPKAKTYLKNNKNSTGNYYNYRNNIACEHRRYKNNMPIEYFECGTYLSFCKKCILFRGG